MRRSEHDQFMYDEAVAEEHARRVAERRGYPQPRVPIGWVPRQPPAPPPTPTKESA